ncbi:MAG: DUF4340 domain-containing protein [Bacteroidales bacterium]|nr:DUF4340 domain-containing protein [Bacteroidales bacterium]
MKKKNIVIVIVTLCVILAAVVVVSRNTKRATFKQDFHIEDTSTIVKIFLADKNNGQVLLTMQPDSTWLVNEKYPASQAMVDMLLETLNDMRIRQRVNKNAIENVVKDISTRGVKVDVYQTVYAINWFGGKMRLFPREKLTTTYYVGREVQDMGGSHMYRQGDDVPYVIYVPDLRGFPSPRFVTDPYKWRSHNIVDLNVKQIKRIELNIPSEPEESFAIVRDGDGFCMELTSKNELTEDFDTARVAQFLSSFTWLNFDEYANIVPNANMDSCVKGTPRAVLTITDTANNTNVVETYIKYTNPDDLKAIPDPEMYETFDLNRLYAVINRKDTVLIQYFVFDNILQPASYFLGKTTGEFIQ